MASEEEVVRFIFNGANEMAELMYQLIKWALERREKGRDDGLAGRFEHFLVEIGRAHV